MSVLDLKWYAVAAITTLVAIGAINWLVDDSDIALLKLQKGKLGQPARIVFVGDSSLGHSLDAALMSQLSGEATLNLALTGSYGLAGSRWMLEHYFEKNASVHTAFVVQTLDVFPRPIDNERIADALDSNIDLAALFNTMRALSKVKALVTGNRFVMHGDYPPQGVPIRDASSIKPLEEIYLSDSNAKALREIGQLCLRYQVSCYLALGPISDRRLQQAKLFLTTLPETEGVRILRQTTPMAIPAEQLGDSPDHVAAPYRRKFTLQWLELVRSVIGPRTGS